MRSKNINILRISLIAASIVLIVLGVLFGGYEDAVKKSIRICMECIGLG